MGSIYASHDRKLNHLPKTKDAVSPEGSSLEALRSGAASPTREQMGHRVDLPEAMREKMENAFGADLSAVKLYESETVAEAGAKAVTRGSDIAFAPGMLDFSSFGGQALLGHEMSHVVSQARGEATGGGFLHDAALEARADREGAMAAAGQTIGMPAALSPVTAAPAAGPMQASKKSRLKQQNYDLLQLNRTQAREHLQFAVRPGTGKLMPYKPDPTTESGKRWQDLGSTFTGEAYRDSIDEWDRRTGNRMTLTDTQGVMPDYDMGKVMRNALSLSDQHSSEYSGEVKRTWEKDLEMDHEGFNGGTLINHLTASANAGGDEHTSAQDRIGQFRSMMDALSGDDQDQKEQLLLQIKENYRQQLKGLESKLGTDIHKESVGKLSRSNRYSDLTLALGQDYAMPLMFATQYGRLFDEHNKDDQEFIQLARYYRGAKLAMDEKVNRYTSPNVKPTSVDYNGMITDSKARLAELRKAPDAPAAASPAAEAPAYAPYKKLDLSKTGKVNTQLRTYDLTADDSQRDAPLMRKDKEGMTKRLMDKYNSDAYKKGSFGTLNNGRDVTISGLGLNRMLPMLERSMGEGYSQEDIEAMYDNLMAPHRADLDENDATAMAEAQASFDMGMRQLKGMHYKKLKRLEATYGTLPSQMHPMDLTRLAGEDYNDHFHMAQDTEQLLTDGGKYFNMDDEQDQEFKRLHDYYFGVQRRNHTYAVSELDDFQKGKHMNSEFLERILSRDELDPEAEASVHGPSMTPEQQEAYMSGLHRRAKKGGWQQRLFGRFK